MPFRLLWFPETERRRSARFRRRSVSSGDLKELHDGKEIYEALNQASDPDALKVSAVVISMLDCSRLSLVLFWSCRCLTREYAMREARGVNWRSASLSLPPVSPVIVALIPDSFRAATFEFTPTDLC